MVKKWSREDPLKHNFLRVFDKYIVDRRVSWTWTWTWFFIGCFSRFFRTAGGNRSHKQKAYKKGVFPDFSEPPEAAGHTSKKLIKRVFFQIFPNRRRQPVTQAKSLYLHLYFYIYSYIYILYILYIPIYSYHIHTIFIPYSYLNLNLNLINRFDPAVSYG